MVSSKIVRIVISAVIGLLALGLFFLLWIVSIFTGNGGFYSIVIPAAYLSLIFMLASWIISKKTILLFSAAAFGVCAVAAGGQIAYRGYIQSIAVVREEKVKLRDYLPFGEKTKIALLGKESSLALKDDLPRLDGATALYPLYASFVHAVYPRDEYDPANSRVMCNTTSAASDNLLNGKVDCIFCAEPSEEQLRMAEAKPF